MFEDYVHVRGKSPTERTRDLCEKGLFVFVGNIGMDAHVEVHVRLITGPEGAYAMTVRNAGHREHFPHNLCFRERGAVDQDLDVHPDEDYAGACNKGGNDERCDRVEKRCAERHRSESHYDRECGEKICGGVPRIGEEEFGSISPSEPSFTYRNGSACRNGPGEDGEC